MPNGVSEMVGLRAYSPDELWYRKRALEAECNEAQDVDVKFSSTKNEEEDSLTESA